MTVPTPEDIAVISIFRMCECGGNYSTDEFMKAFRKTHPRIVKECSELSTETRRYAHALLICDELTKARNARKVQGYQSACPVMFFNTRFEREYDQIIKDGSYGNIR